LPEIWALQTVRSIDFSKQFSEPAEQAFPGSGHQLPQEEEIGQLKRENDLLRQERDSLKKASGIFSRGQL
jgi:transposase